MRSGVGYRLFVSVLATAAGMVVCFVFADEIHRVVAACGSDGGSGSAGCGPALTSPVDAFLSRLRIGIFGGLAVSTPVWLYQIVAFMKGRSRSAAAEPADAPTSPK